MARKRRPSPPAPATPPRDGRLAVALGVAVFLLYLPSLLSGLVYDGEAEILVSTFIHDRSNFWDVITFQVMGRDVLDFNRPVHLLSLMLDSLVWGRVPFGYHLTSNLLHAATAALLFLFLLRLLPQDFANSLPGKWAAILGTMIFAVHPLQVEAVAQVTFREDQLAAFFLLLGLFLATKFPRFKYGAILGVFCFLLAAGSKETGFVGPVLLALYWWLYRRDEKTRGWAGFLAAAFLVVGLFIAARFVFEPQNSEIFIQKPQPIAGSWLEIVVIQSRIWTSYLINLGWPTRLSADYMGANVHWIGLKWAVVALVAFVILQGFLAWKSRLAFFGAAVFWLGLAPVSNFLPIYRPMADRFLYLPLIGVGMMLCALLALAFRHRTLFLGVCGASGAAVLALLPFTWQRQSVFANSLNLWQDTVAKSPYSDTAANNLGYALMEVGKNEEAVKSFEKALNLTQGNKADAWAGAALALDNLGLRGDADNALLKAIVLDDRYRTPQKLVKAGTCKPKLAAQMEAIIARLNLP